MLPFPGGGKVVDIDADVIEIAFKTLFELPALAGQGPWWPLSKQEGKALAEPTSRMLARLSPKGQELMSRFMDPIALISAAVVITLPRLEQTRHFSKELRIQKIVEAKRAALSRIDEAANDRVGPASSRPNPDGKPETVGEGGLPGSGQYIESLFD